MNATASVERYSTMKQCDALGAEKKQTEGAERIQRARRRVDVPRVNQTWSGGRVVDECEACSANVHRIALCGGWMKFCTVFLPVFRVTRL